MEKVKVKVQLVTLTYNKKDLLQTLGESLFQTCQGIDWGWTILDNGDDGTKELVINDFVKKVFVEYKASNNTGNFSVQNNHAVLSSCMNSEVIIFLNNDMISHSDFITNFYNLLQDRRIGCAGAVLRYGDNSLQHAGVILQHNIIPANLGKIAHRSLDLHDSVLKPELWSAPMMMNAVTAACMGVRTRDFHYLKGFHEEFSWCFEDVDFCIRMGIRLGKFCVVDPKSVLTHLETQTKGNRNVDTNLKFLQGRYWGFLKQDAHLFQDETYLKLRSLRPSENLQAQQQPTQSLS